MRNLKNKTAVVTGAASGIGRAVALRLAKEGCDLAICCDKNLAGLEKTAEEIRKLERRVSTHQLDVADRKKVYEFAEQVIAEHGNVHVLVNNAGVALITPIKDMEYEDFEWVMNINFWGMVYCTKAFLPELSKHESHIANVSSVWGFLAAPTQGAYTCSKFAIRGFTETLSQELSATKTSVSGVFPGGVKTDIARNARFKAGAGILPDKQAAIKMMDAVARTSSEKAAKIIVSGIKKKKRRILVGLDARVLDMTQRIFPSLYQKVFSVLYNW